MNRSRPSVLLPLATLFLIAHGAAAGPNAGFVVSVDEPLRIDNPTVGQTITVAVRATATTEVKGILISALFDPSIVEFLSYSVGDVTPCRKRHRHWTMDCRRSTAVRPSSVPGSPRSPPGDCWGPSSSR
jgi:hypothetical protein